MPRPSPRSTLFPYTTLFRSLDVVEPEGVEDDDVVDAVQELRSERALELLQHALLHLLVGRLVALLEEPGRRSEEHTSELQSHSDLVCRLLLEKKKIQINKSS